MVALVRFLLIWELQIADILLASIQMDTCLEDFGLEMCDGGCSIMEFHQLIERGFSVMIRYLRILLSYVLSLDMLGPKIRDGYRFLGHGSMEVREFITIHLQDL